MTVVVPYTVLDLTAVYGCVSAEEGSVMSGNSDTSVQFLHRSS